MQARYERQIPILGSEGQEKLRGAKVAVVGVGGLASAVCLYLAGAGVGHMRIIEDEIVELSNLNRQIIYSEEDIGKEKVYSAVEKLRKFNSEIEIEGIKERISEKNIDLLDGMDAIVDCLDNFKSRYILNEACLKYEIPLFHAACRAWQGQVSVVIPYKSACLKCIFPKVREEKSPPVLGSVVGTIATIQATEVIKYIAGIRPLLENKLLIYDAQFLSYYLVELERNKNCEACGRK
ncbi:MAG: HesA/MoeB/ThiF family protein [Thermoplasmatales archaeon]|nr:HesA/MoeB/ThiF family protein [Thermoplasmatales archaeon]